MGLSFHLFFKKRFYLFLFREKGREGEREGEKRQYVVASHARHTGDLAYNSGMCPDWEWNQWPFGLQAGAQSTEPHQPGLVVFLSEGMWGVMSCTSQDKRERERARARERCFSHNNRHEEYCFAHFPDGFN